MKLTYMGHGWRRPFWFAHEMLGFDSQLRALHGYNVTLFGFVFYLTRISA